MTDTNKAALEALSGFLRRGLTAKVDPPRVPSKAKTPLTVVDLIKVGFANNRYKVMQHLLDQRLPKAKVRVSTGLTEWEDVEYGLGWPEVHGALQPFLPGTPYEVWGDKGGVVVLVETGFVPTGHIGGAR